MKTITNPIRDMKKLLLQKQELDKININPVIKEDLHKTYDLQIALQKRVMQSQAAKYNFNGNCTSDDFNELSQFVNKQLVFGAWDIRVTYKIVTP